MDMSLVATMRTERLTLTPVTEAGPEELATAMDDWEIVRWLSQVPWPYTAKDAAAFLDHCRDNPGRTWSIRRRGAIIGAIGLDGDLGYWLQRAHWGQGLMTEAARAVLAAHFTDPDASDVATQYMTGNAGSARVLEKLGFRDVGPASIPSRANGRAMPGQRLRLTRADHAAANGFTLRTARLILRPHSFADVPDLMRIGGDPRVARMILAATVPWPEEDVRRFIARAQWRGCMGFRLGIYLTDDTLIGSLGLSPTGRIYYFLDPAVWGRGLATEAMRAFLAEVLNRFDLPDIHADAFTDNPASARVLEKLGLTRTGTELGTSRARLEAHPNWVYRGTRAEIRAAS